MELWYRLGLLGFDIQASTIPNRWNARHTILGDHAIVLRDGVWIVRTYQGTV